MMSGCRWNWLGEGDQEPENNKISIQVNQLHALDEEVGAKGNDEMNERNAKK